MHALLGPAATKGAAQGTGAAAGRLPAVAASATSEGAATGAGSAQGTSASAAANRDSGAGCARQSCAQPLHDRCCMKRKTASYCLEHIASCVSIAAQELPQPLLEPAEVSSVV